MSEDKKTEMLLTSHKGMVYTLSTHNIGFDANKLDDNIMYLVCKCHGNVEGKVAQINGVDLSKATFDDAVGRYAQTLLMNEDISEEQTEEVKKIIAYLNKEYPSE